MVVLKKLIYINQNMSFDNDEFSEDDVEEIDDLNIDSLGGTEGDDDPENDYI